ncbi:hypothetical protein [Kribbella qitaiheensis]|uniref:hypothetical protein n=1 Tax=Kribbella qitaiheensis TaxID=1544730 RepID=UPI001FE8D0C2|nr:hypothetical protein [Kribbella qitaiheensis]
MPVTELEELGAGLGAADDLVVDTERADAFVEEAPGRPDRDQRQQGEGQQLHQALLGRVRGLFGFVAGGIAPAVERGRAGPDHAHGRGDLEQHAGGEDTDAETRVAVLGQPDGRVDGRHEADVSGQEPGHQGQQVAPPEPEGIGDQLDHFAEAIDYRAHRARS